MKKLKLSNLEKQTLSQKEMNLITGGWICQCSCYYADTPGGSSIEANGNANADTKGGLSSVKGEIKIITEVIPEIVIVLRP